MFKINCSICNTDSIIINYPIVNKASGSMFWNEICIFFTYANYFTARFFKVYTIIIPLRIVLLEDRLLDL
jgi:hypothetical protein